jgi:hypothetical protein
MPAPRSYTDPLPSSVAQASLSLPAGYYSWAALLNDHRTPRVHHDRRNTRELRGIHRWVVQIQLVLTFHTLSESAATMGANPGLRIGLSRVALSQAAIESGSPAKLIEPRRVDKDVTAQHRKVKHGAERSDDQQHNEDAHLSAAQGPALRGSAKPRESSSSAVQSSSMNCADMNPRRDGKRRRRGLPKR